MARPTLCQNFATSRVKPGWKYALPRGYRLSAVTLVPYCRTLVTIEFRGARSDRFHLIEQLAIVSFGAQFEPGRLPSTRVTFHDTIFTVIHGALDGTEPIDGLHWHDKRRVINWDRGSVICRLELRPGESPSVWQALRIAASVVPLTDLAARR